MTDQNMVDVINKLRGVYKNTASKTEKHIDENISEKHINPELQKVMEVSPAIDSPTEKKQYTMEDLDNFIASLMPK